MFHNKYGKIILMFVFLLILASCSTVNHEPITAETPGIWNHFFVYPFSQFIIFVAHLFNESYGLAIIVITIIVRICLLPLMVKQIKNSEVQRSLQPEIEKLQKRKDLQEDPQKYMQELMSLYQKHGTNPMAGCLPLFIQTPILIAFYYAIMRTEQLANDTFLWFALGSSDPYFILPIVAALTTYVSTKISMNSLGNNPQVKMMLYVMPFMIFVAALMMPSALALYWIVGNLFSICQSYFLIVKRKKVSLQSNM